jgi:hypothetical protein
VFQPCVTERHIFSPQGTYSDIAFERSTGFKAEEALVL